MTYNVFGGTLNPTLLYCTAEADLGHGNTEDLLTTTDCSVDVSDLATIDGP